MKSKVIWAVFSAVLFLLLIVAVKTVDVGVPLLAMHSAREMMGVKDQEALERLVREFFTLF